MWSKAALALSARTGGRCCALAPAFRWHRPMRGGRTHSGHHRRQEHSQELQGKVDELGRRGGFVQGQDLVVTSSIDGVIGDVPPWLALELAPTGNPPDGGAPTGLRVPTRTSRHQHGSSPQQRGRRFHHACRDDHRRGERYTSQRGRSGTTALGKERVRPTPTRDSPMRPDAVIEQLVHRH
jgi:hypothetical protein